MLLFVGLGNPGSQHARNRHNIGFMVVEAIAKQHGFAPWRRRFQGVATEGAIGSERALLLLPETYMNESGRAVGEAARFYKLGAGEIIVFHDEIELPPGKVRVKIGGGVAGHNGLRSISAHVGNDYRRVRIGVGHPGDKNLVQRYVLSDFAKDERDWVATLMGVIADNADLLGAGRDADFQNKVHLAMRASMDRHDPATPGNPLRERNARSAPGDTKTGLTITLDERVAHRIREKAAGERKSVSKFVSDLLEREMGPVAKVQHEAIEEFLSGPLLPLGDEDGHLPTREELYREREDELLRRYKRSGSRD